MGFLMMSLMLKSQSLTSFQREKVNKDALFLIGEYQNFVVLIGDANQDIEEKEYFVDGIIKCFNNKYVLVYNDLDPEHETSDNLELHLYLDYLDLWYPTSGLTTKIDKNKIMSKTTFQKF